MNKKYQIFVSSTYEDLKSERDQVIKAVLEMGNIPVGMEMFSAADEEQWKIIARQIDESDYYVVIVAHRYGSMVKGVSYTEKEFDYAVSKGIPIYGFIIDDAVQPLAKDTETDAKKKVALEKFRSKVKHRPIGFWKKADDLHGKVSIALMKAFNTTPRVGWSRDVGIGPEVSQELSRLSKENAELRLELAAAVENKAASVIADRESTLTMLKSIPRVLDLREKGNPKWEIKVDVNLYRIFVSLGPELYIEKSVTDSSDFIAKMSKPAKTTVSDTFPVARNEVKKLFADFNALGLVEPSKRKHPVADKNEYWSLTTEGVEVLKLDRAKKLELSALL
jgi:hypothetical protein